MEIQMAIIVKVNGKDIPKTEKTREHFDLLAFNKIDDSYMSAKIDALRSWSINGKRYDTFEKNREQLTNTFGKPLTDFFLARYTQPLLNGSLSLLDSALNNKEKKNLGVSFSRAKGAVIVDISKQGEKLQLKGGQNINMFERNSADDNDGSNLTTVEEGHASFLINFDIQGNVEFKVVIDNPVFEKMMCEGISYTEALEVIRAPKLKQKFDKLQANVDELFEHVQKDLQYSQQEQEALKTRKDNCDQYIKACKENLYAYLTGESGKVIYWAVDKFLDEAIAESAQLLGTTNTSMEQLIAFFHNMWRAIADICVSKSEADKTTKNEIMENGQSFASACAFFQPTNHNEQTGLGAGCNLPRLSRSAGA